MSQQRCFSIIGDSNISRNMTALNRRASPLMEGCQVISCKKLSTLADCLRSMRSSSDSCIVACLTNFFTDLSSRGNASASGRVEPVFDDLRTVLSEYIAANPDVMLFVSPPMYRELPEWYRSGLPEILTQFSKSMSVLRSPAFHLLPSLQTQDYEDDGVHLTAYAGLKYVVHLFDSSLDVIKNCSASLPVLVAHVGENSRALEDRVVVLERDQHHLRKRLELKTAVDSELADFEENVRNECYFVISGLPQVPPDLVGRDWQNYAKDLVQSKIKLILGRESKIIVVSGLRRDTNPIFLVKLESTDDCKRIRDKFGSSFKAGATPLPDGLKGLSIRIRHTHATRVRLTIMQILAENYKSSNPGSKIQVINYEPRPMMRLTPPAGASDPRVMNFNFIEAVTRLPIKFSKKDLAEVMKTVSGKFKGQLRSLFVVLSDDDRDSTRRRRESVSSSGSSGSSSGSEDEVPGETAPRSDRSSRSRMEVEASTQDRHQSASATRTQAHSSRGSKRGPPSPNKKSKTKHRR